MTTRVLLLSAHEATLRPDTDLGAVVADLLAALAAQPGCEVVHHEITRLAEVERSVRTFRPDVVFNACETFYGESKNEPAVPILLGRLGVTFTGSPAPCLRQCLLKGETSAMLRAAGVSVPVTVRMSSVAPAPIRPPSSRICSVSMCVSLRTFPPEATRTAPSGRAFQLPPALFRTSRPVRSSSTWPSATRWSRRRGRRCPRPLTGRVTGSGPSLC